MRRPEELCQPGVVPIKETEGIVSGDLTPQTYNPRNWQERITPGLVGAVVFTVGFTLIPEAFNINLLHLHWGNLVSVGEIIAMATAGFLIGNLVGEILGGNSPTQN